MNHKGTQTIKTARLVLRRFALEDVQDMFNNWVNDERVTKYLTWPPHGNIEETKRIVTNWVEAYTKDTVYNWCIEYEGKAIGSICAVGATDKIDSCELGYCIGVPYWNKGLMTEACGAVIDFMFGEVGVNRIAAVHAAPNTGSGNVMKKNGMSFEGVLRQKHRMPNGERCDNYTYSILYEEWINYKEYPAFYKYPCVFDGFMELPELSDGEISLVCAEKKIPAPEKKWVPCYVFLICKGSEVVGHINLRIGYTEGLFYGGNIGYNINEVYRGRGYAGKACKLLVPVAKYHGMKTLRISNDVNNPASRRVCEKLGAKLIRAARLPEWTDMYKAGQRYENLFDWDID